MGYPVELAIFDFVCNFIYERSQLTQHFGRCRDCHFAHFMETAIRKFAPRVAKEYGWILGFSMRHGRIVFLHQRLNDNAVIVHRREDRDALDLRFRHPLRSRGQ